MITMREVAAAAGVSQKTVSRVFNNDVHVRPEMRERVIRTLTELNYTPNTLATTFRAGRAPTVAVVVPDVVDPFFGVIAREVDRVAAENDMSVLVSSVGHDAEREREIVESLLQRQPSGLVLASVRSEQAYLKPWIDRTPIVFVDRVPTGVPLASFTENDRDGTVIAVDHLVGHGHRRIAFVSDDLTSWTTRGRLAGYQAAMAANGLPVDDDLTVLGVADRDSAGDAMRRLMAVDNPPTAVFSANGRVSMVLAPVIQDFPLDIVSFGDFPLADALKTPLTVIDQDPARIGAMAAQRIVERLQYPTRRFKRKTVLDVRLIERESCHQHAPLGSKPATTSL